MYPPIKKLADKTSQIHEDMWKPEANETNNLVAKCYAFLRVLEVTWIGLKENRIVNRAAALSFSSLLGLAPLVAISVLISGLVLKKTDADLAVDTIYDAIEFIAPQLHLQTNNDSGDPVESIQQPQDDEIKNLLQQFIKSSQSGAVGIAGTIMLILIVIQLFASIEDTFNDIWGVKRGRNWLTRIVLYWSIISLGALLVFAGIAMFSGQQGKLESFSSHIPSKTIIDAFTEYGPKALTTTLTVLLLAAFYRFIPNTFVTWKSSLFGAAFALCCLLGNNALAFFYVQGVARQRSLYGSLAIFPVLMLGIFVFWVILLLGGRMTYAIQNARFRINKITWDELSLLSQESISLLVFIKMARRFRDCQSPLETPMIADETNLPTQIVNASLTRLTQIGLATPIESENGSPFKSNSYQPSFPLDKITIREFKQRFETFGNTPDKGYFQDFDPCLRTYRKQLEENLSAAFGDQSIEELIESTSPTSEAHSN